jgi:hypothetical protein
MGTPALTTEERLRRKTLIEELLQQGYSPIGVSGARGSALHQALVRGGKNLHQWVYFERAQKRAGLEHFLPDWTKFDPEGEVPGPQVLAADNDNAPEITSQEHAEVRARSLAADLRNLLTLSRYPVINADAIMVDSYVQRRYDRELQDYVVREGKPRTWLTDTLRVAPVPESAGKTFLFTGAQNDALLDEGFWKNLKAYAAFLGAEIAVGPWTYETQWWSENNPTARSYDRRLEPYLCFGQMAIGDNFVFCGEMNTLPTASQPISDLVTYSRNRWAVFPHAKRQLKSVPSTDPMVQAHQVMTTGAVTRPKVIPRKAGVKSLFHHVIGATLVEFDEEGRIFCRQITAAKDGSFYDLDRHVAEGQVTGGHRVRAMTCGDLHLRKLDASNAMATFGFDLVWGPMRYRSSMLEVLRPDNLLLHDIFDNETRNHHNVGDNATSYELAYRGRESVLGEILQVGAFLDRVRHPDRDVIVVEANHDIALDRYIKEGRYRNDGQNIRLGLQLEDAYLAHRERMADAIDSGQPTPRFSLLEHALRTNGNDLQGVSWAHDGYSWLIDGIEVGHHGFRGANGAKGTIAGFARMGRRMTIGDKHSPEIMEGVYCAGCMNLRQGYNKGPSGWAVTHVIQYPDGHRTLITLQEGRWRATPPRVTEPGRGALPSSEFKLAA